MALGLNFGTGADNDGETLFSAFTKINTILSTTTKLSNGDLEINSVKIGLGNGTLNTNLVIGRDSGNNLNPIANVQGDVNVLVGLEAGQNTTSGRANTFIGVASGRANTSGTDNVCIGLAAGYSNTSGYQHTFIGKGAGYYQNGSYNNTFIGINAGQSSTGFWNATAIGADAQPNANNSVTLGSGSVVLLRCAVTSITSISDARDKTDIVEIIEGLEFVDKLKPVTFTWNQRDGNRVGAKASGFVAQDLLELQNESSIGENLDLVSEADPERLEARYSNLLPVLVKAIQELSLEVKSLKSEIELLKAI